VQTTLLSLAIIVILALVAALVGPLFIDWSSYRAQFEARAGRLTGLEFRVTGPIDVRLLPTPILTLRGIEFGRPGDEKVRARTLHIEFALGRLLQGEWRIEDARLEGPEFRIGIDRTGRVGWPVPAAGFAPEGVSIQRLNIEDGRAAFAHDASGSSLLIDRIEFKGELRSLSGPVRGEGSFVAGGGHYPYRIGISRVAHDGSVRIRFNIDPIDRPLTAEADFSIRIDRGVPRLDGSIALARPSGRDSEGDRLSAPWRMTSRFQGDSSSAQIEGIEFRYGRDDRVVNLRGNAKLIFGSQAQLSGALTSPSIDLDRVLSLPEETRRRPLVAIKALADYFSGPQQLPLAVKLTLSAETLTLAGAALQRVSGDASVNGGIWNVGHVEFRAPGSTQIRLSGRFDPASKGKAFEGPVKIDSGDPRALLAWLTDRVDPQAIAVAPFRLNGDIALGSDRIAIERFNAEIDRMAVVGGFAYSWASPGRPARLDASLTAPEIDIDRIHALAKATLGDTEFDRPRQGSLSLKIGRALIGGVEAKQSDIKMRIESDALEIEQLAIVDFAGAALAAKGRIDTKGQSPRGTVTFDFDAHSLDGMTALIETLAAQGAAELRRLAPSISPVRLRASLALDPAVGSAGTNATAKFQIDGLAGRFRVAMQGDAGIAHDALRIDDLATLGAAKVNLSGRLESDDARTLVDLIGLERFVIVDRRPAALHLSVKGPLDGELAVDGQLAAGALNIWTRGTVRAPNGALPTAGLEIKIADAKVPSPRTLAQGRGDESLNASVNMRLDLAEGTLRLTDIKGTVAGASVGGRLAVGIEQRPVSFDGDLEVGMWDLPEMIGTVLGIPPPTAGSAPAGLWPAEPFDPQLRGISGQIAVKAASVALTPNLAARDFQGRIHFGESQLALQVIDGRVAGGRIAGELILLREAAGLIARTRIRLAGANAAELLPGNGSVSGQLTLDIAAEGSGMSPVALISALEGRGSFTLANARLARLNPQAFDTVMRAFDRGTSMDAARVRDRMNTALASGPLVIRRAEAGITIEAGQARMLSNPVLESPSVDLVVNGRLNLAEGALDARLVLSGTGGGGGTSSNRPEVEIAVKGPIDSVKRSIDVTGFANWLALRAVEEQSKKLEVLEGREPASAVPARDAPMPIRPSSPALREPSGPPINPP
jgi:large subunit ribosomal protein L24